MLTVIGQVYQRLGARRGRGHSWKKGWRSGAACTGPDHERVAESLNDLGVLLREKGDYAAASPDAGAAIAVRRRFLGGEHKDLAVSLVESVVSA